MESTEDLRQRMADRNAGNTVRNAPDRPCRLTKYLAFSTEAQALAFERQSKSGPEDAWARQQLW